MHISQCTQTCSSHTEILDQVAASNLKEEIDYDSNCIVLYWPEEEKRCIENIAIIIRKCNHAHLYLLYITYEIYMQKSSKRDNSTCTKTGVEED